MCILFLNIVNAYIDEVTRLFEAEGVRTYTKSERHGLCLPALRSPQTCVLIAVTTKNERREVCQLAEINSDSKKNGHEINLSSSNDRTRVVNIKKLRRDSLPYIMVWIFYYAWVIGFTTWWTGIPDAGSAFSTDLRSVIHITNLISSAVCIFIFKKHWFSFTARIGAIAIIITLGLYLIAPSPHVKALAALLLGASLGCMNISVLIPFTFVLNNTEKLCAVAASHMLSSGISVFLTGHHLSVHADMYMAWFILLISLIMVPFFRQRHLSALGEDKPVIGKDVRPAMAWTVIVGVLGAVLFLGAGKALLNTYAGSAAADAAQWYYVGGIVGGMLSVLIFASISKSVHMVLSIPFGCLAIGHLCNAFGGQVPGMETVFGVLLGIGTTLGMSNTYYILGVVGKKYNSMFFLRISILIIGICGGIPGVLIGNGIEHMNTLHMSIIVSIALSIAVILVLVASPTIARILFNENWAKDIVRCEITDPKEILKHIKNVDRFENYSLTPREKEVCALLLNAHTLRQIAGDLGIAYSTVNVHYTNLYRKLGINSRVELLVKFGVLESEKEE